MDHQPSGLTTQTSVINNETTIRKGEAMRDYLPRLIETVRASKRLDGSTVDTDASATGFALVDAFRHAPDRTSSGAAALVDDPKGHLFLQREDSANSDDGGIVLEFAEPADTSRRRTRRRKIAAARALRGIKPTAPDGTVKARSFTVCICGKFSRNDKGGDLIVEGTANGKTSVGNAQFCGSAWTCADCVMHIGITRGSYVEKATAALRVAGYRVVMTTMTVPHKLHEDCSTVYDRLKAAHARLDADGSYRRLTAGYGYIGRIRVVEITYGDSGWHVHSHELMVFSACGESTAQQDNAWASAMQKAVFPIWNRIIMSVSNGQQSSKKHGFTVVPVWSDSDYVAKLPEQAAKREQDGGKPRWGAQAEITKAHVKKAEKGGRTPWDILDGCYNGNRADITLFREYAQATWNRTQFETTKGLRELLATMDITIGTDLDIIREEPDYIFADELKDEGDQSNMVTERVLIDRASQSAAHAAIPLWLEKVRHDVEMDVVLNLVDAMRDRGFHLVLLSEGHFVATTSNIHARQGDDFDKSQATIAAHYEPTVWRAIYGPPPLDY